MPDQRAGVTSRCWILTIFNNGQKHLAVREFDHKKLGLPRSWSSKMVKFRNEKSKTHCQMCHWLMLELTQDMFSEYFHFFITSQS